MPKENIYIYLYPLDSLDGLQAALHEGCSQVTLFGAAPESNQEVVLTQVNVSELLGLGMYVQDYFSLTNYGLLYEISETDPCEPES